MPAREYGYTPAPEVPSWNAAIDLANYTFEIPLLHPHVLVWETGSGKLRAELVAGAESERTPYTLGNAHLNMVEIPSALPRKTTTGNSDHPRLVVVRDPGHILRLTRQYVELHDTFCEATTVQSRLFLTREDSQGIVAVADVEPGLEVRQECDPGSRQEYTLRYTHQRLVQAFLQAVVSREIYLNEQGRTS